MSTRATLGGVFASLAVLTIGWQLGSVTPPVATAPVTEPPTDHGSFTGSSMSTRFGSVQVAVTVAGGTIMDVTALHLTDRDEKSVQISNRAAPLLRVEVLLLQSAQVDTIGGATYTSEAYLTSLQSALDQAGL